MLNETGYKWLKSVHTLLIVYKMDFVTTIHTIPNLLVSYRYVWGILLLSIFSKHQAASLFTEIRSQFIQGLEEQTWMDNRTREQARIKVRLMLSNNYVVIWMIYNVMDIYIWPKSFDILVYHHSDLSLKQL
jgi:hypothetical protein